MTAAILEQYQGTFGACPEEILQSLHEQDQAPWTQVSHYTARSIGSRALTQDVVLVGGWHAHDPNSAVFTRTNSAWQYLETTLDMASTTMLVEGRVRNPWVDQLDSVNFRNHGELGLYEAHGRRAGIPDERIICPEPSIGVIQETATEHGLALMYEYLVLRRLPADLEIATNPFPLATSIFLLCLEVSKIIDTPETRKLNTTVLRERWDKRHPENQMAFDQPPTRELIEAIREETTFFPCLRTAEEDRSPIQKLVIDFNMRRQLAFADAIDELLFSELVEQEDRTITPLFVGGKTHTLALGKWLNKRLGGYALTEHKKLYT